MSRRGGYGYVFFNLLYHDFREIRKTEPNLDPRALLLTDGERRALGNPETKCLLIGFREEQSKASLICALVLARGVSRRSKVQIANFWL